MFYIFRPTFLNKVTLIPFFDQMKFYQLRFENGLKERYKSPHISKQPLLKVKKRL